jgi:hypothetical protein
LYQPRFPGFDRLASICQRHPGFMVALVALPSGIADAAE